MMPTDENGNPIPRIDLLGPAARKLGTTPATLTEHVVMVHLTESQVEDHIRQRTAAEARRASDIERWRERTTE